MWVSYICKQTEKKKKSFCYNVRERNIVPLTKINVHVMWMQFSSESFSYKYKLAQLFVQIPTFMCINFKKFCAYLRFVLTQILLKDWIFFFGLCCACHCCLSGFATKENSIDNRYRRDRDFCENSVLFSCLYWDQKAVSHWWNRKHEAARPTSDRATPVSIYAIFFSCWEGAKLARVCLIAYLWDGDLSFFLAIPCKQGCQVLY